MSRGRLGLVGAGAVGPAVARARASSRLVNITLPPELIMAGPGAVSIIITPASSEPSAERMASWAYPDAAKSSIIKKTVYSRFILLPPCSKVTIKCHETVTKGKTMNKLPTRTEAIAPIWWRRRPVGGGSAVRLAG